MEFVSNVFAIAYGKPLKENTSLEVPELSVRLIPSSQKKKLITETNSNGTSEPRMPLEKSNKS